ncbi:MAG: ShlB/FhaC/HecB family hemolysin secretion/activation protein, partial [Sneathiella sp.]
MYNRVWFFRAAIVLSMAVSPSHAWAQSSANPSRIDERVRPRPETPTLQAPLELPAVPETRPESSTNLQKFKIEGVVFEGSKTLPDAQLQETAKSYLNREITLRDVYDLADKVTALYRASGYVLSRAIVPAQQIDDGFLKIQIVEGFIDKIDIQGDAGGARRLLEEQAQRIKQTRPLTAAILERELLLAGDLAGLTVRSVLTPSETEVGAADLTLIVETKPFDAYLAVDNYSSRYLGREEIIGQVFANDMFDLAGQVGVTAVVTPDTGPEMAYGALSYQVPLTAEGLSLFSSYSYSRTRPGEELKDIDTKGKAEALRVELSYPFYRARDFNFSGTIGMYGGNVSSENIALQPVFDDKIRHAYLRLFVNGLDDQGGYNTASVSYYRGVSWFGASKNGDANLSRPGADNDYQILNFDISRWQPLVGDFSLLLAAAGQTSFNDTLLSSEEWSVGGSYFSRAFDPSEISGEKGLAGSIELQYTPPEQAPWMSNSQFFGFYEGGVVAQTDT